MSKWNFSLKLLVVYVYYYINIDLIFENLLCEIFQILPKKCWKFVKQFN